MAYTSVDMEYNWKHPYEKKRAGGCWCWHYVITFEGDEIPSPILSCENADRIVAMLNGAYNLGQAAERTNRLFHEETTDNV